MSYDNRRCTAYGVHGTVGRRYMAGNRQTAVCDKCRLPIYAVKGVDSQWRAEYGWVIHEEEELADAL